MTAVVTAVCALISLACGFRWLRVAQREHYISGSCRATAMRWVKTRPPNRWLAGALVLAVSSAAVSAAVDVSTATAVAATLTAVLALVFPWGMRLVGAPRVRFTRRARTLAAVGVVGASLVWAAASLVVGAVGSIALISFFIPLLMDGAMAISAPLEARALERHRRKAAARLAQLRPFVIAVTGSFGKTSTKTHIRDLILGSVDVVASPASWNNTAGMSRTMNEHLTEATEVLVVEMGMYGPGEIRSLCEWVPPDVAVICSIGPMHLERVGSIEGIVAAKSEILERAKIAVLWVDDPHLDALSASCAVATVVRVGTRGGRALDVEVEADPVTGDVTVWAAGERLGICPATSGAHAGNVGCAVGAARAFGIGTPEIAARLGALTSPAHRATTGRNDAGVFVIDDTFNANPAGASAAVQTLARTVSGRRAVVTPGMVELGPLQRSANEALAAQVASSGATLVVVGWTNRRALTAGGDPSSTVVLPSRDAARDWVRSNLGDGDGVLWENDLPDHYA